MMSIENSYTIGELAQAADVTIRTIRYYVAEELLPAPEGGGRAATYGNHHVARLKLIKILKDEFLPLHEIRALLSGLDDQAVAELLQQKQANPAPNSAKAYLQTLLNPPGSPAQPTTLMRHKVKAHQLREETFGQKYGGADAPGGSAPAAPAPASQPMVSRPLPGGDTLGLGGPTRAVATPLPSLPHHAAGVERWQRYQITPEVELHVKEGVENSRLWQKVEQVIKMARQILSSIVIC